MLACEVAMLALSDLLTASGAVVEAKLAPCACPPVESATGVVMALPSRLRSPMESSALGRIELAEELVASVGAALSLKSSGGRPPLKAGSVAGPVD